MKKLFLKLLIFLPIVLMIVGFNYFVDPAHLFSKGKYEYGIAKLLNEKNNVANISNYDERMLQKYILEFEKEKKDISILGSSRIMMIGNNILEGKVLNNGVSGCSLEDIMAIYWMYKKDSIIPKKIIIGLDPWFLNANNGQKRYKSLQSEYDEIINYMSMQKDDFTIAKFLPVKLLHLFSFTYFRESLKVFAKKFIDKKELNFYPTKDQMGDVQIKLTDGTLVYDKATRDITVDAVNQLALEYLNASPVYSLDNFKELDKDLKEKFEKFIALLLKDKVEIIFVFISYHPIVYKKLSESEDYKIILQVQNYFNSIAKNNNIKVIGSYNPLDMKLTEKDFYDGMHIRNEAIKLFLNDETIK